jgi:hypothetical protein
VTLADVSIADGDAVVAHAGHPAEWLPFVVPLLLFAVAWLVIRARETAAAEDGEQDDEDERDPGVSGG